MSKVFIFDTCALIDFFKYYSNYNRDISDFLVQKIKSEEIIIIDKVEGELKGNGWFKKQIETVKTDFLREKVETNYFPEDLTYKNEKFKGDFDIEKERFLDEYADLYLIELAKHLKQTTLDSQPVIVTNETSNENYNKNLFLKIPTICKDENLEYINIGKFLFNDQEFKIVKKSK